MKRKLKALGLVAVAVFAMSAVIASAAQAIPVFKASNSSGTVSGAGEGKEEFITEAGTVGCATSSFTGSYASEEAASLTIHPTYSGCKAFGFLTITVNTEECNYVITPTEKTEEGLYDSSGDLVCPAGQSVKVSASTCLLEVKPQEGLKNTTLTNASGGIDATPATKNIAYTVTKDGFLCPFNGTGAKTGGEYGATAPIPFSAAGGATIEVAGE